MVLALLFQSLLEKMGSMWMERRTELGKAMTLEPWAAEHMQSSSPSLLLVTKWVQLMVLERKEHEGGARLPSVLPIRYQPGLLS